MSARRKAGDRVRLIAGAGMCGDSEGLIVTIQPEEARYESLGHRKEAQVL